MRKLMAVPVVFLVLIVLALPAAAITSNGTPDGDGHPNVGLSLAAWDADEPGVIKPFCSGTLISPTVYLTAAHCTAFLESVGLENDEVWVSFDSVWTETSPRIHGTWYTNPAFSQRQSDPGDLAVIVLDEAVQGVTPAQLPEAGVLDAMWRDGSIRTQPFVNVGYGTLEQQRGHGPGTFPDDNVRKVSTSSFNALNKAWLRLSQNQAKGDGGTCYGDSGGPQFFGSSNVLSSVTVTGDTPCYATNVTYRLDTANARSFLDDYVPVP